MNKNTKFNYDYTKTMSMKILMAEPDKNGGSKVHTSIEQALEIIKKVDAITQNIPKIYYLVGWQYLGHDDKYPDFFEVNEALKREQDKTALESLLWLIAEGEKYNSIVSVHINFNDAYENAPSFETYVKNKAFIRDRKGNPHAIEIYNNKKCYKVSFKEEWESGLFKERFDKLLTILPLEKLKTVHVDNFQCYKNYSPKISIATMQEYRKKMLNYVIEKGIDITSEFTYREYEGMVNKPIFGLPRKYSKIPKIDTLGLIPASWWTTKLKRKEYVEIPPQLYGGRYKNFPYFNYLYGNMHGEDLFLKGESVWKDEFLNEFATVQVPYNFLCSYKRLAIKGFILNEKCIFENDIVSYFYKRRISYKGNLIKDESNLCLPFVLKENTYFAYSLNGDERVWTLLKSYKTAKVYKVTENGNIYKETIAVENDKLKLKIAPKEGLFIELE